MDVRIRKDSRTKRDLIDLLGIQVSSAQVGNNNGRDAEEEESKLSSPRNQIERKSPELYLFDINSLLTDQK